MKNKILMIFLMPILIFVIGVTKVNAQEWYMNLNYDDPALVSFLSRSKEQQALEKINMLLDEFKDDYYFDIDYSGYTREFGFYFSVYSKSCNISQNIQFKQNYSSNLAQEVVADFKSNGTPNPCLGFSTALYNDSNFDTWYQTQRDKLLNITTTYNTSWMGEKSFPLDTSNNYSFTPNFRISYYSNIPYKVYYAPGVEQRLKINGTVINDGDNYISYFNDINNISLELKKELSFKKEVTNKIHNKMEYIDIYFDKSDLGKRINFELELDDYYNYSSCTGYCEKLIIDAFDISYLVKENGLYVWKKLNSNDTGVGVDFNGSELPGNENGKVIMNGKLYLDYDSSLYNFEQIRISFHLNNGNEFTYKYSDDSTITSKNIDEYYTSMLLKSNVRGNRVYSDKHSYFTFSTFEPELKTRVLVEYLNDTTYSIYPKYYDITTGMYLLNNGENYIPLTPFNQYNRDFEYYDFVIGTQSKRSFYIYKWDIEYDTFLGSGNDDVYNYYYYYVEPNLYFSFGNDIKDNNYINDNGDVVTGITPSPEDTNDTDNNFANIITTMNEYLSQMRETSAFFNQQFELLYSMLPAIVKMFIVFSTHFLCIFLLMKLGGYK